MAERKRFDDFNCSLARAVDIVGDRWVLLILRDAFLGADTFGEFQTSLGVAKNILSERLERLVESGVFVRSGAAARPRYQLTKKGLMLAPALVALMQWGDVWMSNNVAPIEALDQNDRPLDKLELTVKGKSIAGTVRFRPGPGAVGRTKDYIRALNAKRSLQAEPEA